MSDYRETLVLEADPDRVTRALTTTEGLRGWWTEACEAEPVEGGSVHLCFGDTHKRMRVERLVPGREVRWRCQEAHIAVARLARRDEWVGTAMVFRLLPLDAGRTRLEFVHEGLVPALECFELCRAGWAHFLESLRLYAATGRGTPYRATTGSAACAGAAA